MFPKYLRIVTPLFTEYLERINKTTRFWKQKPLMDVDDRALDILAEVLGFSYEFVFAPDGKGFGERLPNGSWTKALGMIQRREADLLIGKLDMTQERNEAFHLSYPFAVDEITFVTKKPEAMADNAVFLRPFSIQVWISIIACIFIAAFLLHCLLRRRHSAIKVLTSTLSTLVGQGIELTPQRLREYFVLGSWILGSSLLYYFYVAVLLSFLTFPSTEGIKTIDDLAKGIKNGKYECATYENSVHPYVLSQQNSSEQVIGNELLRSMDSVVFIDFVDYLEFSDKKAAFVGLRSEFNHYKDSYFVSKENIFSSFAAFATHKDFCCSPELDKVLHQIWASGIFEKFSADDTILHMWLNLLSFGDAWNNQPSEVPLTMTVLKAPFIFLIVSHSLAFLVFLVEVCVAKFKSI